MADGARGAIAESGAGAGAFFEAALSRGELRFQVPAL